MDFNFRGIVPFLVACGVALGFAIVAGTVVAWRVLVWVFDHVRWVP
jgi:hypothetical protein